MFSGCPQLPYNKSVSVCAPCTRKPPNGPLQEPSEIHYRKISWAIIKGQKRTPKPKECTNSTKEFSEQVEGDTGHYPVKLGFWGKSHQKVHPKVRQNLCRTSSLGYLFCPWRTFLLSRTWSEQTLFLPGTNLGFLSKDSLPLPRIRSKIVWATFQPVGETTPRGSHVDLADMTCRVSQHAGKPHIPPPTPQHPDTPPPYLKFSRHQLRSVSVILIALSQTSLMYLQFLATTGISVLVCDFWNYCPGRLSSTSATSRWSTGRHKSLCREWCKHPRKWYVWELSWRELVVTVKSTPTIAH